MATLTLNPDEPLKNELIMLIYNIKDEAVISDLYQMMKSRLGRKSMPPLKPWPMMATARSIYWRVLNTLAET